MGRGKSFAPDTDDGTSPYAAPSSAAIHSPTARGPLLAAPVRTTAAGGAGAGLTTATAASVDSSTAAASATVSSTDTTTTAAAAAAASDVFTSHGVVPNPDYISPCGSYKGNTIETFQWIDLEPKARDMYIDIKYTHDFKLRSGTYLSDKKKVCVFINILHDVVFRLTAKFPAIQI